MRRTVGQNGRDLLLRLLNSFSRWGMSGKELRKPPGLAFFLGLKFLEQGDDGGWVLTGLVGVFHSRRSRLEQDMERISHEFWCRPLLSLWEHEHSWPGRMVSLQLPAIDVYEEKDEVVGSQSQC